MPTSSSTDAGLPLGDPVGDPTCPMCRGLGYVGVDVPVGHPHFGRLFPCACRTEELMQERSESLQRISNIKALERYTFETFYPEGKGDLSPERISNLRQVYERAMAYAQRPDGWLLLRGSYGCGKTHLAAAIANVAVRRGMSVIFVTVPDLLDHLRSAFSPSSTETYDERFDEVRTAPLLILDDLGTENTTPWALEKLFQIFNYRYMGQLPTVITTNHDVETMEPRLRSRLADLDLVEMLTILAPDFRRGVDRADSDLNTLHLYSEMTLEAFDLRRGELGREEAENLARALELARNYATHPEGLLAYTGAYGSGKTHLAAGIANARVKAGQPALFVVVPDLLDHLRAAFSPQSAVSYDKRFDEVRRAPFLVLDDLGTESATPWAQEKLYQLFNYRYVAKLPTVVTTSRPLEDLDPKLRIRLLDVARCTVFSLRAPAYLGGIASEPTRKTGRGGRKS